MCVAVLASRGYCDAERGSVCGGDRGSVVVGLGRDVSGGEMGSVSGGVGERCGEGGGVGGE